MPLQAIALLVTVSNIDGRTDDSRWRRKMTDVSVGVTQTPCIRSMSQTRAWSGPHRRTVAPEVFQHPTAMAEILARFGVAAQCLDSVFNPRAEAIFRQTKAIHLTASGRSYHAGMVACSLLERFCRVPARIDLASEYCFRRPMIAPGTLFVTIGAPGERRDALAALRMAKGSGYLATLAMSTADDSEMLREADLAVLTDGGAAEKCISRTSFTKQLVSVCLLTATMAEQLRAGTGLARILRGQLEDLVDLADSVLTLDGAIESAARELRGKDHVLYVAQECTLQAIARDGALELTRTSHVPAEAFVASELKYGSLARVNEDIPVVALAPNDELREPLMASLRKVHGRRGGLYVFADPAIEVAGIGAATVLRMPRSIAYFQAPVAYSIALQLLAHHVSRHKTQSMRSCGN